MLPLPMRPAMRLSKNLGPLTLSALALMAMAIQAQQQRCDLVAKDTVITNGIIEKTCLDLSGLQGQTIVVPSNVTRVDNDGLAL